MDDPLLIRSGLLSPVATAPMEVELEEPDTDEVTAEDRPWIVLVWNDPINLMSYVTLVLQKLFGYSLEKAEALMLDVHHKGRAVVSNGTKEKAELDVFRLHEHGLWATMQQD
ncbi:MAG TPA: ATP-dependent Clp protease adapter ClpS [Acidimicrobiales bacterium]